MAYTTIDKPTDYFNTVLYTGNGSSGRGVTGVGFSPNWVWIKNRGTTGNHQTFDTIRGVTNTLQPDRDITETAVASMLTAFDSDGFTVGDHSGVNDNTNTYVSWNWLAGGTSSSNTDGSITSTVSANTTAGFSIVSYTGTGSAATIGHGLSATPKVVIVKRRTGGTNNWRVQHESLGATKALDLDNNAVANTASGNWNDTAPTSSVFSVGTFSATNNNTDTFIAYCFAEKKGYSKFGSYTGNGSTDGTFVYTGFKPSLIITRNTGGDNWMMVDNKRGSINLIDEVIFSDLDQAEVSTNACDFTANGFKARTTSTWINASGGTYIYMAFAENPFVTSTGIPTTAR